jgi:GDP-4-dehydro-6-deoxy-D-mannose reductase
MRVLVTGITGFAGSHLAEYLLAEHPDVAVYGTVRWRSRMENLEDLRRAGKIDQIEGRFSDRSGLRDESKKGRVTLLYCELTDPGAVDHLIGAVQPDRIFHLAAQSFVQSSFDEPASTFQINVGSQLNLLEALRRHDTRTRMHIAGSSEEYGLVHEDEVPMTEENPLRPLSPYAVSKVAQDKLAYQYHRSYGIKAIVTRGFNHCGPRQTENFVVATLAKQIADIEAGLREPVIEHGDLSSKRDLTDVRDMVRAYWALLERGEPGEAYNIGSGTTRTIREVLDGYLALTGTQIALREDPARMRPSDVKILWADDRKFRDLTDWAPQIPFEQTLRDTLDWWISKANLKGLAP